MCKNISKKCIHGEIIINSKSSYKGPVIYAVNQTNVSDTPVVWVDRHSTKNRKNSTVGEPIAIGINEDAITAITQLRDIMAIIKYE